jgi:hypothetical protein
VAHYGKEDGSSSAIRYSQFDTNAPSPVPHGQFVGFSPHNDQLDHFASTPAAESHRPKKSRQQKPRFLDLEAGASDKSDELESDNDGNLDGFVVSDNDVSHDVDFYARIDALRISKTIASSPVIDLTSPTPLSITPTLQDDDYERDSFVVSDREASSPPPKPRRRLVKLADFIASTVNDTENINPNTAADCSIIDLTLDDYPI